MPNPVAQQEFINATYQKAGLDLSKLADRPQYFEAHGTGTPAGDQWKPRPSAPPSLDLASGLIEPQPMPLCITNPLNLLSNELSARVKPFYTNLRIVQEAQQWPEVQTGDLRCASVNGFGFGAKKLEDVSQNSSDFMTISSSQATSEGKPRLLGVFTGQGAQWATMGADLLRSSPLFSGCIDKLQSALNTLPAEHTALSQPLCTAVQVALVTLLKAAQIDLTAVVGHSSGEIAAAHAAGYLSAEDSIRIAYYRGFFLKLAGSEDGAQGGMMAVGTSHEDAEELCELPSLRGRICIAARNSPSSLTLSGDLDAIEEAKEILEDEQKFARLLKVDKVYHSHHMKPCFEPYVAALKTCDVKVLACYTGPFQTLSNTSRRLDKALGTLGVPKADGKDAPSLIVHPGILDCAIQSIMLAFSYPGDGRLRTIYLPTKVDRLRINLAYCRESTLQSGAQLPFYSSMADNGGADLSGDIEVHSVGSSHTIIQLQGIHATPLDKSIAENDANIFSELTWGPEIPTGTNFTWEGDEHADDLDLSFLMEKVSYFYLRQIDAEFPKGKREGFEWRHGRLFDYIDHCLEYVASGTHPYAKKEWINDKREDILKIIDSIDLRILKAVGENMPNAIRGDMNILEAMMHGNMLNDFYA
ncbi:Acyl transferase/acyl hydrolase/lysophospholipase [Penicillium fimorum]|uniref:Acyl transferase/acyl hydrolase/lysophospholipase n=1 Tax=Penicillium fimorum TaxID=1882269 RepID=A0A9W9XLM8_9EURO|nr:Acyl transferase/acyl hydrolase/lysophospholipase [Penicillium fimorum]